MTSCWRGYLIGLEIKNDLLYARRRILGFREESRDLKLFSSEETPLDFSGAILISDSGYAEYREAILAGTEALELHFTNGRLDDVIDHSEIYERYEEVQDTLPINAYIERRRFVDSFLHYQYHEIESYKEINERKHPGFLPRIVNVEDSTLAITSEF